MKSARAFTLIELLVVIGVIALLIGILVPSLGRARATARAVKCGAQLRSVGIAVAAYCTEWDDLFPISYFYVDSSGAPLAQQNPSTTNAYRHWSYALYDNVKDLKAFTCPEFEKGGAPRTNPGQAAQYWMPGQVDASGNTSAASAVVEDLQAPFIAFTANAALMPRNKLNAAAASADGGDGQRWNKQIKRATVQRPSHTILATEFNKNWQAETVSEAGGLLSKAHRPIHGFYNLGGGTNEYATGTSFFVPTSPTALLEAKAVETAGPGTITDPNSQLNAVGRNHPGNYGFAGRSLGGSSNFIYVDGHVDRKNLVETMTPNETAWEWGTSYYTLTGDNSVKF